MEKPHAGPQPEADARVHEGPGIPHAHGGQVAPGILYSGCHSNRERVRLKGPAMWLNVHCGWMSRVAVDRETSSGSSGVSGGWGWVAVGGGGEGGWVGGEGAA